MEQARRAWRWLLATGIVVTLGRWPLHLRAHPAASVLSGLAVAAVAVSVCTVRSVAPLRLAAGACLVDALIVARAWSARLPAHCDCVRRAGAPALVGWAGVVILADVLLVTLAVWLSRSRDRQARTP